MLPQIVYIRRSLSIGQFHNNYVTTFFNRHML
jgi:hypothetical protein